MSLQISLGLVRLGRGRDPCPEGLKFVDGEEGTFLVDDLATFWRDGRHSKHELLDTIRKNMYHEGGEEMRFNLFEHSEIGLCVKVFQSRHRGGQKGKGEKGRGKGKGKRKGKKGGFRDDRRRSRSPLRRSLSPRRSRSRSFESDHSRRGDDLPQREEPGAGAADVEMVRANAPAAAKAGHKPPPKPPGPGWELYEDDGKIWYYHKGTAGGPAWVCYDGCEPEAWWEQSAPESS
eukprot:s188_g9.t1